MEKRFARAMDVEHPMLIMEHPPMVVEHPMLVVAVEPRENRFWDISGRICIPKHRSGPNWFVGGLEVEGEAEVEVEILRDPTRRFVDIF